MARTTNGMIDSSNLSPSICGFGVVEKVGVLQDFRCVDVASKNSSKNTVREIIAERVDDREAVSTTNWKYPQEMGAINACY